MSLDTRHTVATWIVVDTNERATYFPQLGNVKSSDARVQFVYWRCVAIFFATAYKLFGDRYRLALYTNAYRPGEQIAAYLAQWNVEIRELPIKHLPPPGYFGAWSNQFYILDIIGDLASREDTGSSLVLDSDCVFTGSLDELFGAVEQHQILTYDIGEPEDLDINGLTRREMAQLFQDYSGLVVPESGGVPRYFGGEFFAASPKGISRLHERTEPAWLKSLERSQRGEKKFNEEAHLLSFLYYQLGVAPCTANSFIKRFWTGTKQRNGLPGDQHKSIWHVPAEKKYGLARLYPSVQDNNSWFWKLPTGESWLHRMQALLGVPRPNLRKQIDDYSNKILTHLGLNKAI